MSGRDEESEAEDEESESSEEEPDMSVLTKLYQPGDTFGIMAWRNEDGSLRTPQQKHDQVRATAAALPSLVPSHGGRRGLGRATRRPPGHARPHACYSGSITFTTYLSIRSPMCSHVISKSGPLLHV